MEGAVGIMDAIVVVDVDTSEGEAVMEGVVVGWGEEGLEVEGEGEVLCRRFWRSRAFDLS